MACDTGFTADNHYPGKMKEVDLLLREDRLSKLKKVLTAKNKKSKKLFVVFQITLTIKIERP